SGWLARGLLSRSRLGRGLLGPLSPLGPAGRPGGRGRLVEAELLLRGPLSPFGADPAARAGADTGRGTVSHTGPRMGGWFPAGLLPQAGRVSSRGRDTLV